MIMNNLAIGYSLVLVVFAIAAAAGIYRWGCSGAVQIWEKFPFSTSSYLSFYHTKIEVFVVREEGMLLQIITIVRAMLVKDQCVVRDLSQGDLDE